jgi:hypothetical protein
MRYISHMYRNKTLGSTLKAVKHQRIGETDEKE